MGSPKRQTFGYRTVPVYNETSEWVPSFGLMMLTGLKTINGKAIRNIGKPSTLLGLTQNAAICMVNGPIAIPPGGYGQGSQDWPLQVLHETGDGVVAGASAGPVADSWAISAGGHAFTWQGVDPTNAYQGEDTHDLGLVTTSATVNLVGFSTIEDHPGQGKLFTVNAGVWDPVAHEWGYNDTIEFEAVDNRAGVPNPEFPATGLGIWRPSVEHGTIIEILDLDCNGSKEEPI